MLLQNLTLRPDVAPSQSYVVDDQAVPESFTHLTTVSCLGRAVTFSVDSGYRFALAVGSINHLALACLA